MTDLISLVRSLRTNVHNLLSNTQLPPDKIQELTLQNTVVALNKQIFSIKARTSETEYSIMCDTVTQLIGVTMEFIALKNARQPTTQQKESGKRLLEQFQLNCKEIATLETKRQKQSSTQFSTLSMEQLDAITSEIQQASQQKKIIDIESEILQVLQQTSGYDTKQIQLEKREPGAHDDGVITSSSSEYSTESSESSRKNSEDSAESSPFKNHTEATVEPLPAVEIPSIPADIPTETPNSTDQHNNETHPSQESHTSHSENHPLENSDKSRLPVKGVPVSWIQQPKRTISFGTAKTEIRRNDLKRAETQKEPSTEVKNSEFFPRKNYAKRPSIIDCIPESSSWIKIPLKPEKPKKFFLSKQRKHDSPNDTPSETPQDTTTDTPVEKAPIVESQPPLTLAAESTPNPTPSVKFEEDIFEEARQLLERNDLSSFSNALSHMNINMQDPEDQNNTLLHWSVGYNNLEATKILVERGAKLFPNDSGINPLHMAVQLSISNKSYEPVKTFLKTL